MTKKLWILLILALCLSALFFSTALADTVASGSCGENVTWTLDDTGLLTISGTGPMRENHTYQSPFPTDSVKTAVIENGVTSIGNYTFSDCSGLTSVAIPSSVTSIGEPAFSYCTSLTSIKVDSGNQNFCDVDGVLYNKSKTSILRYPAGKIETTYQIPESVTSIGNNAFSNCDHLIILFTAPNPALQEYAIENCVPFAVIEDGIIPTLVDSGRCGDDLTWSLYSDGLLVISGEGDLMENYSYRYNSQIGREVTTAPWGTAPSRLFCRCWGWLGDYAFYGCTNLTCVSFPRIWNIGKYAFYGCTGLTSIHFVNDINQIESSAFEGCTSLSSVSFNYVQVSQICARAFKDCTSLKSISFPRHIDSIYSYSFYGCTSLTSVTITASVHHWMGGVFSGCMNLTNILVSPDNYSLCSVDGVLFDKTMQTLLEYPAGKTEETYQIPDGVTSIGNYAFYGSIGLTNIAIPEGVTSIGNYAFYGSIGLTNIAIPEGVTSIGSEVFSGCTRLTSVTIPESVTSIDFRAFRDCTSLPSVTIPPSVTSINSYAFSGCSGLTSIQVSQENQNFCSTDGVLFDKEMSVLLLYPAGKTMAEYQIPNGVTSIGRYAFNDCTNLTSVIIPDSITSIGEDAFDGCTSLISVIIPDSVTSIGEDAFDGCTSLISVIIPDSVTSIVRNTFYGCTSLISVIIPDSVTSIGEGAFSSCTSLISVTIPQNVTSIGYSAFRECKNLTDVYYTGRSEQWAAISIGRSNECLTNAVIHYNYGVINNILTLPASLTTIESKAFAGLINVDAVSIPATVTSIADDAFDAGIVIIAPAGSYAETWAKNHGFKVKNP